MSASVQEWSAAEVASTDSLPENFLGLLEWVLDESVVAAKDRLDGDFDRCSSQEVVMDSPQAKEITSVGTSMIFVLSVHSTNCCQTK